MMIPPRMSQTSNGEDGWNGIQPSPVWETVRPMKLVQVLLPPDRLAAVQEELAAVEVFRMTVSDVQGVRVPPEGRPLTADSFESRPMVKLEIGVNEEFVRPTIRAVLEAGAEAGKVFLLPIEDVIRIRTGEHGTEAI